MESGIITVGVLQPNLLGWQINGAASAEISAQNAQPCCWGCSTLTVMGGQWFLEVQSSLTQCWFITCCLQLWQLIPETSLCPKNPNRVSFPEALMALAHRWALSKLKSSVYPALPQGVLSGAVHTCESREMFTLAIHWFFSLCYGFFYLYYRSELDDLLFPTSLCSCSSACRVWTVPYEPCSQQ